MKVEYPAEKCNYTIDWPADFDTYAWEIELKGWLDGVKVIIDGKTFAPVFYDPTRLNQEIEDEILSAGFFSMKNLIVVHKVCRHSIETALSKLALSGDLK